MRRPLALIAVTLAPLAAGADLPPGALSADMLRALAERDGLVAEGDPELHRLGARWLTSQRTAELDGQPPREHIVEVTEYTGEGTWQTELHPYRAAVGDALPEAMGDPIISGGYRDPGYLRIGDLDDDGRDELLVVGDTSGDSVSAVSVWRWDGGWRERWWGPDPGVDYVPFDPAGVGSSAPLMPSAPAGVVIAALPPVYLAPRGAIEPWVLLDGRYRPWPTDPGPWLGGLMAHIAAHEPPRRPAYVLPPLADALRRGGLRPPNPIATQHGLQAMHRQTADSEDHAALLDGMAWPGNAAARPHLRAMMAPPHTTSVRAAAARSLVRVGGEADLRAILDRLTVDAMPELTAGFMGYAVVAAIVQGFAERNDPRARARLTALVAEPALSEAARVEIVRGLGVDTAAVPGLLRASPTLPPALRRAVVGAAWSRALSDPDHAAWRVPGVADAARALLKDPDPLIAGQAVELIRRTEPAAAAAALRDAIPAAPPRLRTSMLDALAEIDPDADARRAAARQALAALPETSPHDPTARGLDPRSALHDLIARHGDDSTRAAGVSRAETSGQIDAYARAFADRPPERAARGALVEAALPLSAPDRPDRIRQAATRVLGGLDDDRARAALMLLMRSDPVFYVRSGAAEALGRRHPEVEAALIVALVREGEAHVRGDIIEALGRHGTPRARAALIDRLSHPTDGWHAAHALARVPDAAGLEVGLMLARHAAATAESPGGCERVSTPIGALARAGLDEAEGALRRVIAACPDARTRLVTHAIEQWQREGSDDSRRRVAAFADDPDRAISRAAWSALARGPD